MPPFIYHCAVKYEIQKTGRVTCPGTTLILDLQPVNPQRGGKYFSFLPLFFGKYETGDNFC
jgi:hypothetical protein